jgi:short-subunit dehydrogenase
MKVTLITGASSGIGEAFARKLAASDHDLVLVARSEKLLHELCDELMLKHKIFAHYLALDLLEENSVRQIVEETDRHGFEVEWLINNAGFGSMGDFAELEAESEADIVRLNVLALVRLTHAYIGGMRDRRHGTIINVSSSAGFQPVPFMATYAATKAFVTSFSEAIAEENKDHGIRVMALCPGPTKTNFFRASAIRNPVPFKGMQSPEQVVDTALRGLKKGRTTVISGWANYAGSVLGKVVPTAVTSRVIANTLRDRIQEK